MRVSSAVFRWLSAGILAIILLLSLYLPVSADTGTYEIQKYGVTLEPLDDGRVGITIDQTWRVLTGNIPWITVGLPNDHFDIESSSLAVKKISKSTFVRKLIQKFGLQVLQSLTSPVPHL